MIRLGPGKPLLPSARTPSADASGLKDFAQAVGLKTPCAAPAIVSDVLAPYTDAGEVAPPQVQPEVRMGPTVSVEPDVRHVVTTGDIIPPPEQPPAVRGTPPDTAHTGRADPVVESARFNTPIRPEVPGGVLGTSHTPTSWARGSVTPRLSAYLACELPYIPAHSALVAPASIDPSAAGLQRVLPSPPVAIQPHSLGDRVASAPIEQPNMAAAVAPVSSVSAGALAPIARNSDAAEGNAPVPLRVEVRVTHQAAQVIEIPWGLAATGALSYRSTAEGGVGPDVRWMAKTPLVGYRACDAAMPAPTDGVANLRRPSGMVATDAATAASAVGLEDQVRKTKPSSPAAGASIAAQAPEWLQRMIRWLESAGEAVLYVRDYRLGEEAAAHLAKRLGEELHANGTSPVRIVINGRSYSNPGSDHAR